MQPLASDLNNPEFVGAVNPDSLLHVEFYMHHPIDKWATDEASYKAGRRVVVKIGDKPVPFVRIMKPGDNTSIIETSVREEHKQRWPQQWLYFQMNEGLVNDGSGVSGWKIEDWDELKDQDEQIRDLKYRRFYTVEQIAGANDAQVQGMGIGGTGLRERARAALRGKVSDAIAEKDAQLKSMQEQMQKMQEQMAALLARPTEIQTETQDEHRSETKKRRGRPPKAIKVIENGEQHAA